jgi:hypothetical protein
LLQQTGGYEGLREATDGGGRQTRSLCDLAIAQQIRSWPKSAEDVGPTQQRAVGAGAARVFFKRVHGKLSQGLPLSAGRLGQLIDHFSSTWWKLVDLKTSVQL